MTDDLITTAEMALGLILDGKQSATGFNPEWFPVPYNKVLVDFQKGSDLDKLQILHGEGTINACLHASARLNGRGSGDWISIMKAKSMGDSTGKKLERIGKNMQRGLPPPSDELRSILESSIENEKSDSVRADEIITDGYSPFEASGSEAIDGHLVGLPKVGTIILGAKTFQGKTTVAIKMASNYLEKYPDKEVLFITLEDMAEAWLYRARIILGDRPKSFWHRFIIKEFVDTTGDVLAEASRYPNLGMVVLDYIDYLVKDKSFETYAEVYRGLAIGAKRLATTHGDSMRILICAQFSRQYTGGVPTPSDVYYTGEAGAWSIFLLYNPSKDWSGSKKIKGVEEVFSLPAEDGKAYICVWKMKAGYPNHPEEFPGAIKVGWSGKYGYDLDTYKETGQWFSLSK